MMHKVQAGWIGFRDKGADFWTQAEALAQLGYMGMEGGEGLLAGDDPAGNVARFHGLGLRVLTISANRDDLSDAALAEIVKKAQAVKTDRATIWCGNVNSMFWDVPPQYDAFMQELERYEAAAVKLAAEGIKLTYHNHFQEFTEIFKGVRAYNYMLTQTAHLHFLLDVAWATYGGMDPVDIMRRMDKRLVSIHVKDYKMPEQIENPNHPNIIFTGLGTGIVNIEGVLRCASEMTLPYVVVEQDHLRNLSNTDTLRLGYYFMKETGYVS